MVKVHQSEELVQLMVGLRLGEPWITWTLDARGWNPAGPLDGQETPGMQCLGHSWMR